MSKSEPSSRVSADGLRYSTKIPGSPFAGVGHTRSCFLCGAHRQSSALKSKRVLGRVEMVCAPSCSRVADGNAVEPAVVAAEAALLPEGAPYEFNKRQRGGGTRS